MSPVLEVRDVWKMYPDWTGQTRTLRGALSRRSPLFRASRSQRWALRGVTLTLRSGQGVGVIGHNGSGKSTLLRLMSGLGRPTRGTIRAHPDTTAVLSFGSSFDLQLTGRENALTAALISGMSRRSARRALETMLDFSELGEFVDAPVRTYSEGMKLRLAFGLIAALNPRLLVLDEVLAVGDAAFRSRCLDRISRLRGSGTSLMLASHSMSELRDACAHRRGGEHRAVHPSLPGAEPGAGGVIELTLDRLDLRAGEYKVDVGLYERDWEHVLDFHWAAYRFRIRGPVGSGALAPPHSWRSLQPSADQAHG